MTALGTLPATDPLMPMTLGLDIYQTDVDPTAALLYNQISRRTLLKRAKEVWGEALGRDLRRVIDDTFKGFSYDREYPRELFLDHHHNQLWACCYKRPKRQDPEGRYLIKTVIPFPDVLPLDELHPEQCPLFALDDLSAWGEQQAPYIVSRVPLLGLPGYQESFLQEGLPSQQIITVSEQYQNHLMMHLDLRWYLLPNDSKLNNADLARRVPKRVFYDNLRGHYPVVKEHVDRLLSYLAQKGIEPHFLVTSAQHQRNLTIIYTFDVMTSDGEVHVVSGSLSIAQRRRNELQ